MLDIVETLEKSMEQTQSRRNADEEMESSSLQAFEDQSSIDQEISSSM